jgi:DNA topoisomerase IA
MDKLRIAEILEAQVERGYVILEGYEIDSEKYSTVVVNLIQAAEQAKDLRRQAKIEADFEAKQAEEANSLEVIDDSDVESDSWEVDHIESRIVEGE